MADTTKTSAATSAKTNDPSVFFEIWRSMQLVWHLMLDSRVPFLPKLIVPFVILYILSPIDILPEALFLFLGTLDDIALLFFGTKLFINMCPPDIVMEHRRALGGGREFTADDYVEGTYRVVDEDKK